MADRVFRKGLLLVPLLLCVFGLFAFGQSNTKQSTTSKAGTAPLEKALEMNVAEVEVGKLAQTKAENPKVKDFADMMVKDHNAAIDKLRTVPGAPSAAKPNAKQQQTADRLSKLSGPEFDREYMKAMVTDHQEAVKFFELLSKNTTATTGGSPQLAMVAQELLPTLKKHLQMAQEIQKELQSTPPKTTRK
jgi:putative membrane protein